MMMDFKGQAFAETVMMRLLELFGAMAFLIGYSQEDYMLMVKIMGLGLAVTSILVLPPWPVFRRHPIAWLPPLYPDKKKAK